MFKGISLLDFRNQFRSVDDCKAYLYECKWGKGYNCKRCGHSKWYKGRTRWYRKCASCQYDESVTSNTLFHKMKLNLLVVFEIAFQLSVRKKGMSSCEIARTYGMEQKSAWLLKRKIQQGMNPFKRPPLKGEVHVDEFVFGGKEFGKPGRSRDSRKTKVVLGCEVVLSKKGERTLGNAYARVIDGYKTKHLWPFFKDYISAEKASVKTDKWPGYSSIAETHNITQVASEKGKNFPEIHTLIMLLKGWLRGIHHKASKNHFQQYLDEFFFRFNRKGYPEYSFNSLIGQMMNAKPLFLTLREVST